MNARVVKEKLLLIWRKGIEDPAIGSQGDEGWFILCGAPYGDSVVMAEEVEHTQPVPERTDRAAS